MTAIYIIYRPHVHNVILAPRQVSALIKSLGIQCRDADIDAIFSNFDVDQDGAIDVDEFIELHSLAAQDPALLELVSTSSRPSIYLPGGEEEDGEDDMSLPATSPPLRSNPVRPASREDTT